MSDTQTNDKLTALNWTVGLIIVGIILICLFDPGKVIWRDNPAKGPLTETVWVCTGHQVPLTADDWNNAGPGYPPPLGKYRVTYNQNGDVSTIEALDLQSTAGCDLQ